MINRIVGSFQSAEDLEHLPELPSPAAEQVTAETPMELWVPKDLLVAVVEASLQASTEYPTDGMTREMGEFQQALIRQREVFLDQLQQHAGEDVYMAVYPKEALVTE